MSEKLRLIEEMIGQINRGFNGLVEACDAAGKKSVERYFEACDKSVALLTGDGDGTLEQTRLSGVLIVEPTNVFVLGAVEAIAEAGAKVTGGRKAGSSESK